jgi:hypothetical protein
MCDCAQDNSYWTENIGKNNKETAAQIIAIIPSILPGWLAVGSTGTVGV